LNRSRSKKKTKKKKKKKKGNFEKLKIENQVDV